MSLASGPSQLAVPSLVTKRKEEQTYLTTIVSFNIILSCVFFSNVVLFGCFWQLIVNVDTVVEIDIKCELAQTTLAQKILFGFCLFDKAQENMGDVVDDDKGRGQGGTAVIFYDQVIALKLPEDVCILLHHLEGVAVESWYKRLNFCLDFCLSFVVKWTHKRNVVTSRKTFSFFLQSNNVSYYCNMVEEYKHLKVLYVIIVCFL